MIEFLLYLNKSVEIDILDRHRGVINKNVKEQNISLVFIF